MYGKGAGRKPSGRGMMSISSRISYAIRRVFNLVGRVMAGPYHAHLLETPREVYRAIVYVLMNNLPGDHT